MGNLRASDYKFNRNIHLPREKNADKEAKHNMRREEMIKIFDDVMKQSEKEAAEKGRYKGRGDDSNLSKEELKGLKSLKKERQ